MFVSSGLRGKITIVNCPKQSNHRSGTIRLSPREILCLAKKHFSLRNAPAFGVEQTRDLTRLRLGWDSIRLHAKSFRKFDKLQKFRIELSKSWDLAKNSVQLEFSFSDRLRQNKQNAKVKDRATEMCKFMIYVLD